MNEILYRALKDSGEVQRTIAALRQATGMPVKLVPVEARKAGALCVPKLNPACVLLVNNPRGQIVCQQFQNKLCRSRRSVQLECYVGLNHVVVPVVLNGQHVATLWAGRVRTKLLGRAAIAKLVIRLRRCGVKLDGRQLAPALGQSPLSEPARLTAVAYLFHGLAKQWQGSVTRWLTTTRRAEPVAVTAAREFTVAHLVEPLPTHAVAQQVGLSEQHFCRIFKQATGLRFTDFVARLRVEKAKALVETPNRRITEVAADCGFGSLPHFERIFKRHTGQSPKAYRAALFPALKSAAQKRKST